MRVRCCFRLGVILSVTLAVALPAAEPSADWPVFRHDRAQTSVSPGKGRIRNPSVLFEHYLGTPSLPLAADRDPVASDVADLDGDGREERFALNGKTITVSTLEGRELWSSTVEGQPLGGNVRVAKLFPDRKGTQIISFSSRMDTGDGQGYCFSFQNGAAKGELAWTTGPLTGQYAPTLIVDDVDADGLLDVVTAPHYRVQIWNGQNGTIKAEVPWDVGRNYGILLSHARPGGGPKDIIIVCDFVLHVDCIRLQDGKWIHAWGQKYFDPNQPVPRGREMYIRVGPNPVVDLEGDGSVEVVYMFVDAAAGDLWRLRARDVETGKLEADLDGIWLWSLMDIDNDGVPEVIYTPTRQKRPRAFCDLHVANFRDGRLVDRDVLRAAQPILRNATLPPTANTIADEGLLDLLWADLDGDHRLELFHGIESERGKYVDRLRAVTLGPSGKLEEKWRFERLGHRLNLIHAGATGTASRVVRVRDLTAGKVLEIDAQGKLRSETDLGKPGGFSTTPIAVDLDGDGKNEVVVQNAAQEITALRLPSASGGEAAVLWSSAGVAMNPSPGYTMNGLLSPQAADIDGDDRPEVLFAREDGEGLAALVAAGPDGKIRWSRSFPGCAWGGLQAGVNLWTFGRFTGRDSGGRERGLDVYVDVHSRSKGSSEGLVLRGDSGEVVWRRQGLVADETAMPFGGGLPAVADLDGDGRDDLVQLFWTVYGAVSGSTGEPLFPPAFLWGKRYFGKWLAYSSPTLGDLDGDGKLEVYLNSASSSSGGYAAVEIDGKPLWSEFHQNDSGPTGFGPVGDFDGDGKIEVVVPAADGTMVCLRGADGSHLWKVKTPAAGDAVAADVDGDSGLDVVFSGSDGRMRALSGRDGRELWSIPAGGRPIIADADGDRLVEVLAVGYDGILRVIGESKTTPPAAGARASRQDFASDPGWDGFRNRLVPDPPPVTRQDFGYAASQKAGGAKPGEIGGWVQRSLTPAWYAKAIPERTLEDRFTASGRLAVVKDGGGSGVLFGWFNESSRGWRTPNSLVFRLDGNGGKYWLFYEYGTRDWFTGGGGAFEGERYQETKTSPFKSDGKSHNWSLEYDPAANGGGGEVLFRIDDRVYRQLLAEGHKANGATFNRFGIFNQQITGDGMELYFDDLVIDGRPEGFDSDPGWEANGTHVEFPDRVIRPRHDFGYTRSRRAGGEEGEIGGIIWRDEAPAYYGEPVGPFSLEDELFASGRLSFNGAGSDSGVYLGWFNSESKRSKTTSELEDPPKNFAAILLEGPSRIGHYFRGAYRTAGGEGITDGEGPIIRPDGKPHRWSLRYSPQEAAGRGRLTVTLDGETRTLDLSPGHRAQGARFDRFGLFNLQAGGHFVEVYVDEISYGLKLKH